MNFTNEIFCPICKNSNVQFFTTAKDYQNKSNKTDYLGYRCENCSAIFQYPFPDLTDFDNLYPDNYYAHIEYESIPSSLKLFDFLLKQKNSIKYFSPFIRFIFPYFDIVKNSKVVLDIGCGKGTFLNILKNHNIKTYGIEPDPNAINILKKNGHIAIKGDILSSNFSNNFFDVITLFQVLEHIENHEELIKETLRILKPGGYLLMVTPNGESNLTKKYKNFWRGLEFPRHLILHCPKSINCLFGKYNYKVNTLIRVSPIDIKESFLLKNASSISSKNVFFKILLFLNIIHNFLFKNNKGSLLTILARKNI